jgi:hypothetical protein
MLFRKESERLRGLLFRYGLFLHPSILSLFPNSLQKYLIRVVARIDTRQRTVHRVWEIPGVKSFEGCGG